MSKIQKKRWKLACKRLKVVLLLHHVGPTLPESGGPGKPQTPSTLQTDGKIFYETCSAHRKVHRPINHPKCKNGLEPPASGCPLRRPLQERSLCKVGQQRRRRQQVQGWVQLHPPIRSLLWLPASIAAGVAAVYTTATRQSVWVEGGVRLGSFLSDKCNSLA